MSEDDALLVGFDHDAVLTAARGAVGEDLLICVVYDDTDFRTIYVDETVDSVYEDEDARREHFGQIYSYVHLDVLEGELFEELLIDSGSVKAFNTFLENLVAVRVVAGREGVFLGVRPGTEVTELVGAVRPEMEQ